MLKLTSLFKWATRNNSLPTDGRLVGGSVSYQGSNLPIIDLCWIVEGSVIKGSFALVDPCSTTFNGTGNLWIDGWTFVGTEITGQRIGQLIHPGHQFMSFTASFIVDQSGDIIGMAKRKQQTKRLKKSVLEKKAAKQQTKQQVQSPPVQPSTNK